MPKTIIPDLEARFRKPLREIIVDALTEADGNVGEAAGKLGVPVGTFCNWMYRHQVRRVFAGVKSA